MLTRKHQRDRVQSEHLTSDVWPDSWRDTPLITNWSRTGWVQSPDTERLLRPGSSK